jgi:hypothetical protein
MSSENGEPLCRRSRINSNFCAYGLFCMSKKLGLSHPHIEGLLNSNGLKLQKYSLIDVKFQDIFR